MEPEKSIFPFRWDLPATHLIFEMGALSSGRAAMTAFFRGADLRAAVLRVTLRLSKGCGLRSVISRWV
jgi:hypothetical protein